MASSSTGVGRFARVTNGSSPSEGGSAPWGRGLARTPAAHDAKGSVQTLHASIRRLYPSFPFSSGHRIEIALSEGPYWLKIESDIGVPSPLRDAADAHLHIRASLDGQTQPLFTLTVVRPQLVTVRDIETTGRIGAMALDPDATVWLYVPTFYTPDLCETEPRRVWTQGPRGFRVKPSIQREAVGLLLKVDCALEKLHWIANPSPELP